MAAVSVQVIGANELRALFKQMEDVGLPKELAQANKSASQVVADRAIPQTPVGRTGRLRGSVKALGSQASGRVRAGNTAVPYAAAIHWGRRRGNVGSPPGNHPGNNPIRGRPFLWEAAQEATPNVVIVYRERIDALLAQIG